MSFRPSDFGIPENYADNTRQAPRAGRNGDRVSPRTITAVEVGDAATVPHLEGFGESHHSNTKRLTVRRPA